MMILFVGSENRGFFAEEVAAAQGQKVLYTGSMSTIQTAKEKMIEEKYANIIIDIEQFIEPSEKIAQALEAVQNVVATPLIIFAPGIQPQAQIVQTLLAHSISLIITSAVVTNQREQLTACLDGKHEMQCADGQYSVSGGAAHQTAAKNFKTIAVSGVCRRIGTTTQALQIVKYLQFNGYKACYIEMNSNQFVSQLSQVYSECTIDKDSHKVTYQNVDMYYQKERISDILKKPYDYFVYDYGSFDSTDFNAISFLEKDISFVVCGAAPSEWDATNKVICNTIMSDIFYIFSFCDSTEYPDILEFMEEKSSRCIFADFCPDFFAFTANRNKLYEQHIVLKKLNGSKPGKKGLFRRKRSD